MHCRTPRVARELTRKWTYIIVETAIMDYDDHLIMLIERCKCRPAVSLPVVCYVVFYEIMSLPSKALQAASTSFRHYSNN